MASNTARNMIPIPRCGDKQSPPVILSPQIMIGCGYAIIIPIRKKTPGGAVQIVCADGTVNATSHRMITRQRRMHVFLNINLHRKLFIVRGLLVTLLLSPDVLAQDRIPEVLVLHSFRTTLPVNTQWYNGIVKGLEAGSPQRIHIDVEAPDFSRFVDSAYLNEIVEFYRQKYRDNQPDLIIPTFTPALGFLLEYGEDLFPGVPIVFCAPDSEFVRTRELPPHITGITSTLAFSGTIELAIQLRPGTELLAVVVGSGVVDRQFEVYARQALAPLENDIEITWLRGLPIDELHDAIGKLPRHSVLLYLSQTEDRTGRSQVPINVLRQISKTSPAPIFGLYETLVGHGIVGGRMARIQDYGIAAGQIGLQILNGTSPVEIPIVYWQKEQSIVDGQELLRWNIDESLLPMNNLILNREPTIWVQYRSELAVIASVLTLQALLIFGLLINRTRLKRARNDLQDESDRRRLAETTALRVRKKLARFSKRRFLGAMAGTIAHEINQPLVAIQNYARAAIRRAENDAADGSDKQQELLTKIESQASRAGDILKNIRTVVATREVDAKPTSLQSIITQVTQAMGSEFEIGKFTVNHAYNENLPEVLADELQIQLVLVNLLHNAMNAMTSEKGTADKVITVAVTENSDRGVVVSVSDSGPGISPDRIESVFEPLFSGVGEGMGMGLAICKMIIDSHGERIWCEQNQSGGARFQFTLRNAPA